MKYAKRIAGTVINALKSGVVPRVGLSYIAVGRQKEIEALLHDVGMVQEGGATFRFLVGAYGSGKSFLLQTIRSYAMDRGFVVCDADLSPERWLHGSKGQGLATYRLLIQNCSTKLRPEGNALGLILDRWLAGIQMETAAESGLTQEDSQFAVQVQQRAFDTIRSMDVLVNGYEFATLMTKYYHAYLEQNDETKGKILKWFRGEYQTKTEAKAELGIHSIITDQNWYEYIKLFALFFKKAGYAGMLMLVDELVNLYKLPNAISRQNNYEKILTMYNDTLQGGAQYLGIIMSGTPQCMEDNRRGIYSYEALRSRLAEGKFSREGYQDWMAPVIRLQALTYEEMTVLVEKLTDIHAQLYDYTPTLTQDDLIAFIQIEYSRIGANSHITPREVIRDFIEMLNILHQNPDTTLNGLMASDAFIYAKPMLEEQNEVSAEFAEFEV